MTQEAMPRSIPPVLERAMARVLDADADADQSPTPESRLQRIHALQTARATLAEWREGDLTTEQAVERLEAIAQSVVARTPAS